MKNIAQIIVKIMIYYEILIKNFDYYLCIKKINNFWVSTHFPNFEGPIQDWIWSSLFFYQKQQIQPRQQLKLGRQDLRVFPLYVTLLNTNFNSYFKEDKRIKQLYYNILTFEALYISTQLYQSKIKHLGQKVQKLPGLYHRNIKLNPEPARHYKKCNRKKKLIISCNS